MAFIVTLSILVDEAEESSVYDGLNEMLREAQMGGPNGEFRGLIVDWQFNAVEPVSDSLADSIANGTYEEGDAFSGNAIAQETPAPEPFTLIVEAYAEDEDEFGDGPSWAELTVTPAFLQTLERLRRVCQDENLESVTVSQGPNQWDQEDNLRIRGDSLRVWQDGSFWFEAHPKHSDYNVETRSIPISDLILVAERLASNDVKNQLPDGFLIRDGVVFYGTDPAELADSISGVSQG